LALLFAAPHFSWGVGGAVGLDTARNREIVEHRGGWFLALNRASRADGPWRNSAGTARGFVDPLGSGWWDLDGCLTVSPAR
jgi:hypothetical protein